MNRALIRPAACIALLGLLVVGCGAGTPGSTGQPPAVALPTLSPATGVVQTTPIPGPATPLWEATPIPAPATPLWGPTATPMPTPEPSGPPPLIAVEVTTSDEGSSIYGFACAIVTDGQAYCWGRETSSGYERSPRPVIGLRDAVSIDAGRLEACAVTSDGQVMCWKWWDDELVARALEGVEQAVAVTVGGLHGCALVQDGSVVCWGYNPGGQLGTGAEPDDWNQGPTEWPPSAVPALSSVTAVSAGEAHTCAVTSSGATYCWGYNHAGQLGDGTTETRASPVEIIGAGAAVDVAAGESHTCVRQASGGVRCWGEHYIWEDDASSVRPVDVPVVDDATDLAAGFWKSCVVHATGRVTCWGHNKRPFDEGLDRAKSVDMGGPTCVLLDDGGVSCWDYHSREPYQRDSDPGYYAKYPLRVEGFGTDE